MAEVFDICKSNVHLCKSQIIEYGHFETSYVEGRSGCNGHMDRSLHAQTRGPVNGEFFAGSAWSRGQCTRLKEMVYWIVLRCDTRDRRVLRCRDGFFHIRN